MAELTAHIVQKLPVESGTSKTGNAWTKQNIIVEDRNARFPRKVCVNFFGTDRVAALEQFPEGTEVTISYDLESREFNGRWYTDVNAWRIQNAQPVVATPVGAQPVAPIPAPQVAALQNDPLPFGAPAADANEETPF